MWSLNDCLSHSYILYLKIMYNSKIYGGAFRSAVGILHFVLKWCVYLCYYLQDSVRSSFQSLIGSAWDFFSWLVYFICLTRDMSCVSCAIVYLGLSFLSWWYFLGFLDKSLCSIFALIIGCDLFFLAIYITFCAKKIKFFFLNFTSNLETILKNEKWEHMHSLGNVHKFLFLISSFL